MEKLEESVDATSQVLLRDVRDVRELGII